MVTPSIGIVVLVRFPFSDLSNAKLRPAIVLADADRDDWILCQVTSQRYTDLKAIEITGDDFVSGSLKKVSYARPSKLFTANSIIIERSVGVLNKAKFAEITDVIVSLFSPITSI
ncbi:MAG: type II toxin-antitoxin system PemK/MazF family toxin [Pyrinomonadaceae bacterium]